MKCHLFRVKALFQQRPNIDFGRGIKILFFELNQNGQCHNTHHLQKAKPEFLGSRLSDVFALISHYAKIHYFRLRVKR